MNLANKLTLARMILVPFFVAALLSESFEGFFLALIIFVAASVTDWLDGRIARKYHMITAFGKFLDPIADKVLVSSALICFAGMLWVDAWAVALIIAREFIVSGIRLAAVESKEKIVISARFSGKLKTAFTMIAICAILIINAYHSVVAAESAVWPRIASNILMYICAALTVISGVQYAVDYRGVFK